MSISYLDGPRLRRTVLAACEYVQSFKAELNRINVFPVPDGDTGTNLALTARAIANSLSGHRGGSVSEVAQTMAHAAVLGARGNCGMMISHYLLGFSRSLDGLERVDTQGCATALSAGARTLESALDDPVEGTILTVMRDTGRAAQSSSAIGFQAFLAEITEKARQSLARTPELLPVLAKASVVDAGAKGFVAMLEGALEYVLEGANGKVAAEVVGVGLQEASPLASLDFPTEREAYRYCTECLVEGSGLPSEAQTRVMLRGDCEELIVIRTGDILKVHLHTDNPEAAFATMRTIGTLVSHKAEDMWAQFETARASHDGQVRRAVGILTDTASDLPDVFVQAHGIQMVPLHLVSGSKVYQDRFELSAEEFHRRMAAGGPLPTTSQPPPGSFVEGFRAKATEAEAVVGVIVGSGLSGTYNSAEAAARLVPEIPVTLMDSGGASLLLGLFVLKAAELAESGLPPEEVVAELNRIRERSNMLFTVETLDRILASGRISKTGAWFGGLLDLRPILSLKRSGLPEAVGKARGRKKVKDLLFRLLEEAVPRSVSKVRFGVVHVGAPGVVGALSERLRKVYGSEVEVLSAAVTPVVATHLGIGAWGIAYMVED